MFQSDEKMDGMAKAHTTENVDSNVESGRDFDKASEWTEESEAAARHPLRREGWVGGREGWSLFAALCWGAPVRLELSNRHRSRWNSVLSVTPHCLCNCLFIWKRKP